jgi:TonB family protein
MPEISFMFARVARVFYSAFLLGLIAWLSPALEAQESSKIRLETGTRPIDFDEPQAPLDSPPTLNEELDVRYTESERRRGHTGIVIVHAAIDERGEVVYAVVTKACNFPALDSSALHAVATGWFKPAHRDGKPVAARITIPVQFTNGYSEQLHDVQKTSEDLHDDVRSLERSKHQLEDEQRKLEGELNRLKEKRKKAPDTPLP